jgi:hypothetical protein
MPHDPLALVSEYHRNLPDRIIQYLHGRGISNEIITLHRLGWNGQRITIPVFNRDGALAFFKFAKDPEDQTDSPKMLTSRGGSVELYGWERVLAKPPRLIICAGEFDRLVLEDRQTTPDAAQKTRNIPTVSAILDDGTIVETLYGFRTR